MHYGNHIGVIPARKNSRGVPQKNRYLFGILADFITDNELFDRVIVTTDDDKLLEIAQKRGFEVHQRPRHLADDNASIKQAFEDLISSVPVGSEDYLWLLFIPLVYRNAADFHDARALVNHHTPGSLCSFKAATTHPYACWSINQETGAVRHFVKNDVYNRQDFPDAWENYNYLSTVRVRDVRSANANLITEDVYPYLMNPELAQNMVEVDEPDDLKIWRQRHPKDFKNWADSQPDNCPLLPLKD